MSTIVDSHSPSASSGRPARSMGRSCWAVESGNDRSFLDETSWALELAGESDEHPRRVGPIEDTVIGVDGRGQHVPGDDLLAEHAGNPANPPDGDQAGLPVID